MKLTESNYFSKEAEQQYMGSSQFRGFMECEAAQLAKINGQWEQPKTKALLVGSYIDAHFSGTMAQFKADNPQIFKRDGNLYADYVAANDIIRVVEEDPFMMDFLAGDMQTIKTGTIAGVPFKVKFDCYVPGKRIVDLKAVKDFTPLWNDELKERQDFIKFWGYDLQAAIYQEVEGARLPFYIAAVTKEAVPDKIVIEIPQEVMGQSLDVVQEWAPHFQAIKQGLIEPKRCEKCDYCKATKKLSRVVSYWEVAV